MKKPFDPASVLRKIEKAVSHYPKAAMFELYERGYTSVFEQLLACLISIRTLDETTIPLAEKLFSQARTPREFLNFTKGELADLLHGTQYPGQKAETMLAIATAAVESHDGALPADYDMLISFKGVGPKCAKLALGVAAGFPGISVDVHVHRVVNRWGFVKTRTPEQTMKSLEELFPERLWIDVNRLLMPFGKHICLARSPFCSSCPVLDYCAQIGVTSHR